MEIFYNMRAGALERALNHVDQLDEDNSDMAICTCCGELKSTRRAKLFHEKMAIELDKCVKEIKKARNSQNQFKNALKWCHITIYLHKKYATNDLGKSM